jgi:hypothetical protein
LSTKLFPHAAALGAVIIVTLSPGFPFHACMTSKSYVFVCASVPLNRVTLPVKIKSVWLYSVPNVLSLMQVHARALEEKRTNEKIVNKNICFFI